ncbi:hypothetical protein E1258_32235, partial [Micromonospora sp. KC207]
MRGDLDETLARLARREEALRRRGVDPGDESGREPAAPGENPARWDGLDATTALRAEPGRGTIPAPQAEPGIDADQNSAAPLLP